MQYSLDNAHVKFNFKSPQVLSNNLFKNIKSTLLIIYLFYEGSQPLRSGSLYRIFQRKYAGLSLDDVRR